MHCNLPLLALATLIVFFQGWKSGLALDLSGTTTGPFWATLVGPTQYVSSAHYTAGAGSTLQFLSGDSAVSLGYVRQQQSDCVLGNLHLPIDASAYNLALVTAGQQVIVVTRRGVLTGQVTHVAFAYGEPCFWHNVSLYGGDSGAPTFDMAGNLVGTHHYTCGNNCGIDVHLGMLFGLQPPVETNTVVTGGGSTGGGSTGGGSTGGASSGGGAVNSSVGVGLAEPYILKVKDPEMLLP
jgi:uncharacterized membrane protein YgcG